jgi:hypothetical protein
MPRNEELDIPEKSLMSEEEMLLRPLFNDFYEHLHTASPDEVYGPNALTDTSFDRMMHERTVVGFLVGRLAMRGTLDTVLKDAALREGRIVQDEELPHMIISSLARVRQNGEWDNSGKSREARKQLLEQGLFNHTDYPLVAEAIELGAMLKHDGHEAYAHDSIIATEKWLELVEKKKAAIIRSHTGDPAA